MCMGMLATLVLIPNGNHWRLVVKVGLGVMVGLFLLLVLQLSKGKGTEKIKDDIDIYKGARRLKTS